MVFAKNLRSGLHLGRLLACQKLPILGIHRPVSRQNTWSNGLIASSAMKKLLSKSNKTFMIIQRARLLSSCVPTPHRFAKPWRSLESRKRIKMQMKNSTSEKNLKTKFKAGAKTVVARHIWKWMLGDQTQAEFVTRFETDKSTVSRGLSAGQLSFDFLTEFLTDQRLEFADIPLMPKVEVRAIGGFTNALQMEVDPFCRLWALHENDDWLPTYKKMQGPHLSAPEKNCRDANATEFDICGFETCIRFV